MRSLLLTALAAVVAISTVVGSADALNTNHRMSSLHDYRPCGGQMCDGLKDNLEGKYPWWTGVELGKAGSPIKIEAFLSFTCPDCADHWTNVFQPLIAKYGDRVSFIHQPFALPYQPFSYDATQAAFAVYRLTNNDTKAWTEWSNSMFKNQNIVYNSFDLTTRAMWTTFASWAAPFGLSTQQVINAMNGTITSANYDAWYSARFARQRTLPGAPTFIINGWLPFDLDLGSWTVAQWSQWIDANYPDKL